MRPWSATIKFMTVLGHNPAWSMWADSLRAHRLLVYHKVWAKLPLRDQWVANRHFLDEVIRRGDRIVLATPPQRARAGSFYFNELVYLAHKGRIGVSPNAMVV